MSLRSVRTSTSSMDMVSSSRMSISPGLSARPKAVADMRFGDVSIDEQYIQLPFQRNTRGQVDGAKRLSGTRKRARHHDEIHMVFMVRLMLHRIVDQRSFDAPELVGYRNGLIERGQQAFVNEFFFLKVMFDAIDLDFLFPGNRYDGFGQSTVGRLPIAVASLSRPHPLLLQFAQCIVNLAH